MARKSEEPDIRSALEQTLFDITTQHLAKLDSYIPGPVKKAGKAKEGLLQRYRQDPVFSIFGLDSAEYIAAALSGGTITSIHRKLGDIYEDSVATIFAHSLGLSAGDIHYSATIVVDDEPETRSIDAYLPFDKLSQPIRSNVETYCQGELIKLTARPQVQLIGAGLEVRHCYQTGDSKRARADLAMARHLFVSGILPLIPFFCSQSNRGVLSRYAGIWVVKEGMESYQLISELSGFDYHDFLHRNKEFFRQPVVKVLRSLTK